MAGVGEGVGVGGLDETGAGHVVGLDGPGGDGVVVPADAMPIPGGEDVGGAAVLRAGEVAVAVQLVAVLPVAAVVVGVAEAVDVVLVVAVAAVGAGGVAGGVVGVAVLVAALVLVDVMGGGGGVGGGAVVVPRAAVGAPVVALGTVVGAAVVVGAAALGSMAGGGAGRCVDGGWVVMGAGTGRGTICGTQFTEPELGGFAGTDRAGVPDELRGVSDTHGTPEDALEDPPVDPEAETCWPWISEVKSATPGAPAAEPFQ
ncbi:MAG TPA: hypothetical protein VIJ00_09370 [Nakamurella sp.]